MKFDPYGTGVLDKAVHDRLVADMDRFARDANIQKRWIWTPLAETCGADEIDWVRRFKFHTAEGSAGLCYVGKSPAFDMETRMAAIAGALTRNFIFARLMTLHELMQSVNDGDIPDMSCLLVPNFFVDKGQPTWRTASLLDVLIARHTAGLQTVLYSADLIAMGKEYGNGLTRHIEHLYQTLPV